MFKCLTVNFMISKLFLSGNHSSDFLFFFFFLQIRILNSRNHLVFQKVSLSPDFQVYTIWIRIISMEAFRISQVFLPCSIRLISVFKRCYIEKIIPVFLLKFRVCVVIILEGFNFASFFSLFFVITIIIDMCKKRFYIFSFF